MGDVAPSERELEILKALWELREGSVRAVHQHMCPDGELAFNTVQTLLRIMEDKGLVKHRAEGRTFVYEPCHSREQVSSRFLHRVFDGAVSDLVLTMLRSEPIDEDELKGLERMIAKARRDKQKKK